jgi:hypothetical protein
MRVAGDIPMQLGLAGVTRAMVILGGGVAIGSGACSSASSGSQGFGGAGGGAAASGFGGSAASGATGFGGFGGSGGTGVEPVTCEQAAAAKSYVGCDFWPTVVPNNVWDIFDFAVVVANAGTLPADVTVTGGPGAPQSVTVPPNGLQKIFLPWVASLKGPQADECGAATPVTSSLLVAGAAYHLTSTSPVTVYQFNALEYRGAGGPPGKNWSQCPGTAITCATALQPIGCFSFSNDASLLLPSTAMTGNYRVVTNKGWYVPPAPPLSNGLDMGAYAVVTGTQPGTTVNVQISSTGTLRGGAGIAQTGPGGIASFQLGQGDVALLIGDSQSDISGSLVQADKPVQVLAGMPCAQMPVGVQACDHLEESVFPAETLGQHYFVTVPTSPNGTAVGHVVRIYGNVNGTTLSYPAGVQPPGAPTSIDAGQVVEIGQVSQDFEIQGDHEFAVGMFQLGAELVDPGALTEGKGDPAESLATAVEQYRNKYIFLAPDDYDVSYVDVIQPVGAQVQVDGVPTGVAATPIGSSNFGVARVKLGPGQGGAHVLTADQSVGIQVMGYGSYTSYQYPGGSNLENIAPPPPPVQ